MKYEKIEGYTEENFRRITGVKRETFNKIVEIVKKVMMRNIKGEKEN